MRNLKWRLLLLFGILATLLVVAGAANVTILKSAEADYAGAFLKPYYENFNAPVTGCAAPCFKVDTQSTEPNAASGTLLLDNHGIGAISASSPATVSVTATQANDVIVVMVMCNSGITSLSASGGGLTWNTRIPAEAIGTRSGAEFWAYASTTLSAVTVSLTYAGGSACDAAYIAVRGVNTANPFDTNAVEPAIVNANSPTSCTMTTDNPNDLLYGFMMQGGTPTVGGPAGWTALDQVSGAAHWDYYNIVGAKLSSASEAWTATSGSNISGYCDALVQASGSFSLPAASSLYLWSPQFASATSIPAGSLSFQLFADAPAPAADGTATGTWTSGSTFSVTAFSTTKANDVVVLSVKTYKSGASVTATGIIDSKSAVTWQNAARSSFVSCSGVQEVTNIEWYGVAAGIVTADTITVTLSSAPTAASGIAFGVSGADTTTPFDPAAGLPKTAVSACSAVAAAPTVAAVSTLADTDFIFSQFGGYTSVTETAGAIGGTVGTLVNTVAGVGDSNAVEYRAVATSQSSVSCAFGTATTYWGILCDALMPARQAITVSYYTTNAAGAIQSTMASSAPATATALYQPLHVSSSAGAVPASGYVEVVITGPAGAALTVFWGIPKPTLFEVTYTYRA